VDLDLTAIADLALYYGIFLNHRFTIMSHRTPIPYFKPWVFG
jgi:hypothetical protein